jgi:hypothetical protein
MPRKNVLLPYTQTAAMSANATTTPTHIAWLDNIAIQIDVTTSDAVGTFALQGSVDYNKGDANSPAVTGNWIDITLSPVIPAAASADAHTLINMSNVAFPWIRLVYTRSSGTGTLAVTIAGKEI